MGGGNPEARGRVRGSRSSSFSPHRVGSREEARRIERENQIRREDERRQEEERREKEASRVQEETRRAEEEELLQRKEVERQWALRRAAEIQELEDNEREQREREVAEREWALRKTAEIEGAVGGSKQQREAEQERYRQEVLQQARNLPDAGRELALAKESERLWAMSKVAALEGERARQAAGPARQEVLDDVRHSLSFMSDDPEVRACVRACVRAGTCMCVCTCVCVCSCVGTVSAPAFPTLRETPRHVLRFYTPVSLNICASVSVSVSVSSISGIADCARRGGRGGLNRLHL